MRVFSFPPHTFNPVNRVNKIPRTRKTPPDHTRSQKQTAWQIDGEDSRIHTCYTGISGFLTRSIGGIQPAPNRYGMKKFLLLKYAPLRFFHCSRITDLSAHLPTPKISLHSLLFGVIQMPTTTHYSHGRQRR